MSLALLGAGPSGETGSSPVPPPVPTGLYATPNGPAVDIAVYYWDSMPGAIAYEGWWQYGDGTNSGAFGLGTDLTWQSQSLFETNSIYFRVRSVGPGNLTSDWCEFVYYSF